jgi:SAM-dependent methyltransferase
MTDSLLLQESAGSPLAEGWLDLRGAEASPTGGPDWWDASPSAPTDLSVLLAPIERDLAQVRSRARVRRLAEVFTHQREIDAMLDLMPAAFTDLDVRFLEPACGSGNFLVEVLRRKLRLVSAAGCASREQYEYRLLRAIASIYGVDISPENIVEARARMVHVLLERYQADAGAMRPTAGFLNATVLILGANVVHGDTLNASDKIELCEWRHDAPGCFQRVWSFALVPRSARDLFWAERVQDPQPVHYSDLKPLPKALRSRNGTAAR